MTNYYEELKLDPSLSTEELNKAINRLESTWIRREATNPEKAIAMRALIVEARKVFQTEGSRAQYDNELAHENQEQPEENSNSKSRQKWLLESMQYYQEKQLDLAQTAIHRAMQFMDPNVPNDDIFIMAADIYHGQGELSRALEYVNNAIMDNNRRSYYFVRLAAIYLDMGLDRRNPGWQNYEAKINPTLDKALDTAEKYEKDADIGNVYGYYARYFYFGPQPDRERAAAYAKKAVELGETWGNGQNVLDDLEKVRLENLRKQQKKIYEDAVKLEPSQKPEEWKQALELFTSIAEYEDAGEHAKHLQERIHAYEREQEKLRLEEEEKARKRAANAKKLRKIAGLTAVCAAVIAAITFGVLTVQRKQAEKEHYAHAEEILNSEDYLSAALEFGKAGEYKDAQKKSMELWQEYVTPSIITVSGNYVAAIKADGTLYQKKGERSSEYDFDGVEKWDDLVSVKSCDSFTVGLKSDGSVLITGDADYLSNSHYKRKRNVTKWKNIVEIYIYNYEIYGLRTDGTILGSEDIRLKELNKNYDFIGMVGNRLVSRDGDLVSTNIYEGEKVSVDVNNRQLTANGHCVLQLNTDGTVSVVQDNYDLTEGQVTMPDFSAFQNVVQLASGQYMYVVYGLNEDGTITTIKDIGYDGDNKDVSEWRDIVAFDVDYEMMVGVKSDGTVVYACEDAKDYPYAEELSQWTDVRNPLAQQ